jgi:predicted GNAT family acetyltransferase
MIICHNVSEQKFCVKVRGGECSLKYREISEKLWNFESTSVPDHFFQEGIMENMVAYAIDFVRFHDIKILANCDAVQDFLIHHKELKGLLYHPY